MHFSTLTYTVLGFCGAVMALPPSSPVGTGAVAARGTETIYLDNGNATVPVVVDTLSVDPAPAGTLARRDWTDCKGSSACNNRQPFKDSCREARDKIENTQYHPGGGKSGTCAGNCGIFVQGGSTCYAEGWQMRDAYELLRNNGCQACGSVHRNHDGCLITINYVTGC